MMPSADEIDDNIINAIARAQRVAVLTGAGVSAESGIPTFRDAHEGLVGEIRCRGPGDV